jgi:hypothetical protein
MTRLLKKAFDAVEKLDGESQDALGQWLLEELSSQTRWDELIDRSQDTLQRLAREADQEHRSGKSQPLDFDPS